MATKSEDSAATSKIPTLSTTFVADNISGVQPPYFSGRPTDDAVSFLRQFDKYTRFRGIQDNDERKASLFVVLLKDSAGEWLDALPERDAVRFDELKEAFVQRYLSPEVMKHKNARDLFALKQVIDESADDYVTKMRRLASLVTHDEDLLKYAILNGLRPHIAQYVTQQRPKSIEDILTAARIAELSISPAIDESLVCRQIAEMQAEVRRLGGRLDRVSTTNVNRSPSTSTTRRVTFNPVVERSTDRQPTQQRQWNQRPAQYNQTRPNTNIPDNYARQASTTSTCSRCGNRSHVHPNYCPAFGKSCSFCSKLNHFAKVCKSAARQRTSQNVQTSFQPITRPIQY